MNNVILVTGGGRSGKSDHALSLATSYPRKCFVATAEAFDEEMNDRITRHKEDRGDSFITIEEPVEIVQEMKAIVSQVDVILLDCLTVWMGNLMHYCQKESLINAKILDLLDFLQESDCPIVIVTNEVGMGIIPENPTARLFRDMSGRLNQQVAALAKQVTLLVSGVPLNLK